MEFTDLQVPPPKSWDKFEELCRALFAAVWQDPHTLRHGRSGQPQHGVDIYGEYHQIAGEYFGVQCKGKKLNLGKKATKEEFDAELKKSEGFDPPLSRWLFVTTSADDEALQRHARQVSTKRESEGKFPAHVLGWDSLQSLLAQHPTVIAQFYPELSSQIPSLITRFEKISSELQAALEATKQERAAPSVWREEAFGSKRDLGPALIGRPLGPADASACPELPEVDELWRDLEHSFSARLIGSAGAGKSVCLMQVARRAHEAGWRVVRLQRGKVSDLVLTQSDKATLHVIDDAHLLEPHLLENAALHTTESQWLLSAHNRPEEHTALPGTIRLDACRAVTVIANGLKSNLSETKRVVQRVDDRIGDGIGKEPIESRITDAEKATFPWQFCFILGGGWRRAENAATAARTAGADLVLAAAAIRQIASRDALCREQDLQKLFKAGGVDPSTAKSSLDWLVGERLLLSQDDLRCPHQRFSSAIIDRILLGQSLEGRKAVGKMICQAMGDSTYSFIGIYVLLLEFRLSHSSGYCWTGLIERDFLVQLIDRCWRSTEPTGRNGACWLLSEIQCYLDDWVKVVTTGYEETAAQWYEKAEAGAAAAIGHLLGQISMKDEEIARSIVAKSDPVAIARSISHSALIHASEVAQMVYKSSGSRPDDWKQKYISAVDRTACLKKMQQWPRDHPLYAAGILCQIFTWDDEEFGLDLIEVLVPAISKELSENPIESFHELHDLVWHSLRHCDVLGIYGGRNGPTPRMRKVAKKLALAWRSCDLADKISNITPREFQQAAWLLLFISETSSRAFASVVGGIDWVRIDETIGESWCTPNHEIEVFLQVCFKAESAKKSIQQMLSKNLSRIETLSTRLAMLGPEIVVQELEAGHKIALSSCDHFEWQRSAVIVAQLAGTRADLVEALVEPHVNNAALMLSKVRQPFFDEPLLFLRLIHQLAPNCLDGILSNINPESAYEGWLAALKGCDAGQRGTRRHRSGKKIDQMTVAWLIEHSLTREDKIGDVARRLRRRFPARSVPSVDTLEPFTSE